MFFFKKLIQIGLINSAFHFYIPLLQDSFWKYIRANSLQWSDFYIFIVEKSVMKILYVLYVDYLQDLDFYFFIVEKSVMTILHVKKGWYYDGVLTRASYSL